MAGDDGDEERGFFSEMSLPAPQKPGGRAQKPHYHGHRERLRERFRDYRLASATAAE